METVLFMQYSERSVAHGKITHDRRKWLKYGILPSKILAALGVRSTSKYKELRETNTSSHRNAYPVD
jgi:hypothetical protein